MLVADEALTKYTELYTTYKVGDEEPEWKARLQRARKLWSLLQLLKAFKDADRATCRDKLISAVQAIQKYSFTKSAFNPLLQRGMKVVMKLGFMD